MTVFQSNSRPSGLGVFDVTGALICIITGSAIYKILSSVVGLLGGEVPGKLH